MKKHWDAHQRSRAHLRTERAETEQGVIKTPGYIGGEKSYGFRAQATHDVMRHTNAVRCRRLSGRGDSPEGVILPVSGGIVRVTAVACIAVSACAALDANDALYGYFTSN